MIIGPPGCVGVGIDIEAVARWQHADPRLFTDEENDYCRSRADSAEAYAGTWCAKEAVVKAVRPTAPVLTRQVCVTRDQEGAPWAGLPPELGLRALVSISHSAGMAMAVAIAVPAG